ncbi:hypothetical protein L0F63_006345 [Massospora cicadina]|nr:hypothetical protein L0F63_006345 [Massospora cicadina]
MAKLIWRPFKEGSIQFTRRYSALPEADEAVAPTNVLISDLFLHQLKGDLEGFKGQKVGRKVEGEVYRTFCDAISFEAVTTPMFQSRPMFQILKGATVDLDELWGSYSGERSIINSSNLPTSPLPLKVYDALIELLYSSRLKVDVGRLKEVILDKGRDGYTITHDDCLRFLKAAILIDEPRDALDFLIYWTSSGNQLSLDLVNEALRAYWKLGDLGKCLETFQRLQENGFTPDSRSYGALIATFLSKSNFDKAREYATEMFAKTEVAPTDFDFVIGEFANSDDWYGTRHCLELGSSVGILPQLATLTSLVRASVRNYRLAKMKRLKSVRGRQRELMVVNTLYLGFAIRSLPWIDLSSAPLSVEASYVIKDMERYGHTPSLAEYSTLIRGYSNRRQWDNVLSGYKTIKARGLGIDESAYGSFIKALVKLRRWDPQAYHDDLRAGNLAHTAVTFNVGIDLYCREGNFVRAYEVFREMKASKVEPNLYTYTQFFEGMCRLAPGRTPHKGSWERFRVSTLEIFKSLFSELKERSFPGDLALYNMMVNSFSYLNDLDQAQEVYDYMTTQLDLVPDANTVYPIARASVTSLGADSAVQAIQSKLKTGQARLMYATLIEGYVLGRETGKAVALYNQLRALAKGLAEPMEDLPTPDASTYAKLIHGSLKELDFFTALTLLQDLLASNLTVSDSHLSSLHSHLAYLELHPNPLIPELKRVFEKLARRHSPTLGFLKPGAIPDSPKDWVGKYGTYNHFKRLALDVYRHLTEAAIPPAAASTSADPHTTAPKVAASNN